MTNQTYCSPKIIINGVTYNTLRDFSLDFPGNNQINRISFTLSSSDIKEQALYSKPVELYLNYGAEDGLPIFRGIIKDISPSNTNTKFTALDVRSLLSGNNTTPLNITDIQNYDGHTLGQFLQKIIQEDYMKLEYNDDLESTSGIITSNTIAGDGVTAKAQADGSGDGSLFQSGDSSGSALQFIYGQYVQVSDGYTTKRFEFTDDVIAHPVVSGNIAVLISDDTTDFPHQAIRIGCDNLMAAIESNLHIACDWSGSGSSSTTPFIARIDAEQKIAGAIGNTSSSQGYEPTHVAVVNPFRGSDGRDINNDFVNGSGSVTYTGTITTDLPVKRGTINVEVNNSQSGEGPYVVKGSDNGFGSFSDYGAVTTSPHTNTDISPETKISSGSIDYELGTYSLTFANPVWNAEKIRLKYNNPNKETIISLIGTDLLNDTNPPVSLTGYRNEKISPYQVVVEKLAEAIDITDIEKPKEWFIQVQEDDKKSNVVFVKRKSRETSPSVVFSYRDGISSLSYKQRLPANTGIAAGEEGGRQVFSYGNRPRGIVSKDIKITKKFPAEAHKEAIIEIFKEYEEINEVSVSTNKLPYIGLESIIDLNVEDDEVSGKAVVIGKSIGWSKMGKMSIKLKLDRRPVKLSDFIQ